MKTATLGLSLMLCACKSPLNAGRIECSQISLRDRAGTERMLMRADGPSGAATLLMRSVENGPVLQMLVGANSAILNLESGKGDGLIRAGVSESGSSYLVLQTAAGHLQVRSEPSLVCFEMTGEDGSALVTFMSIEIAPSVEGSVAVVRDSAGAEICRFSLAKRVQ